MIARSSSLQRECDAHRPKRTPCTAHHAMGNAGRTQCANAMRVGVAVAPDKHALAVLPAARPCSAAVRLCLLVA